MYRLTKLSRNAKTGGIPVSTQSKATCPTSCPLMNNGCYAETGPIAIHWNAITKGERGDSFEDFVSDIRRMPDNLWRYGQAGDLPGIGDEINHDQLMSLARANRRRNVIAFTHKPMTENNLRSVREAEKYGFHINLSANNIEEVDDLLATGQSVVTVLSSEYQRGKEENLSKYRERLKRLPMETEGGAKIAVCVATYTNATCKSCGVCAKARPNNVVIGFPAHGTKASKMDVNIKPTPE